MLATQNVYQALLDKNGDGAVGPRSTLRIHGGVPPSTPPQGGGHVHGGGLAAASPQRSGSMSRGSVRTPLPMRGLPQQRPAGNVHSRDVYGEGGSQETTSGPSRKRPREGRDDCTLPALMSFELVPDVRLGTYARGRDDDVFVDTQEDLYDDIPLYCDGVDDVTGTDDVPEAYEEAYAHLRDEVDGDFERTRLRFRFRRFRSPPRPTVPTAPTNDIRSHHPLRSNPRTAVLHLLPRRGPCFPAPPPALPPPYRPSAALGGSVTATGLRTRGLPSHYCPPSHSHSQQLYIRFAPSPYLYVYSQLGRRRRVRLRPNACLSRRAAAPASCPVPERRS
eukprot:GHVU01131314.1.p1 GENE.GHVU01131314.1~~GHVU01131314.1.p1  ORF type:complete len:334 (+),score=18.11 GHVU01131314.1:2714-3715(+)